MLLGESHLMAALQRRSASLAGCEHASPGPLAKRARPPHLHRPGPQLLPLLRPALLRVLLSLLQQLQLAPRLGQHLLVRGHLNSGGVVRDSAPCRWVWGLAQHHHNIVACK
jgi:hypothetical protein